MVVLKEIYPFENNGNLILHYAEDEKGKRYYIIQKETGIKYSEAVDIYPCKYTYEISDEEVQEEINELEEQLGES